MSSRFLFVVLLLAACPSKSSAVVDASSSAAPVLSAPPAPSARPDEMAMRTEDEKNTIQIFRASAQATVFVTQLRTVVDYFEGTETEVAGGTGSGFVWDEAGHVVTNFHVVQGAESLRVTLRDQKTYEARLVGVEPR
jgi:S1-C subfamily serine protease